MDCRGNRIVVAEVDTGVELVAAMVCGNSAFGASGKRSSPGTASDGAGLGNGGEATDGYGGGGGGFYGGCALRGCGGGGGSGYVGGLANAQTIAGNTSFPAPSGGNETGHSGNGYARITLVE